MRGLCLSLFILGLSLVSACGVKSPPRPPKPKPTQTSQLSSVPPCQESARGVEFLTC